MGSQKTYFKDFPQKKTNLSGRLSTLFASNDLKSFGMNVNPHQFTLAIINGKTGNQFKDLNDIKKILYGQCLWSGEHTKV